MLKRVAIVAKNLGTVALLTAILPVNLALVFIALCSGALRQMFQPRPPRAALLQRKSILISGGKMSKALQLARFFHDAGHRVVLIESHSYWLTGHRFSRAVDKFYTVPKADADDY